MYKDSNSSFNKNIDYFLLDSFNSIKNIDQISSSNRNNKNFLFLFFNKDRIVTKALYDKRNFVNKYLFIKIEYPEDNKSIGLILPKTNKFTNLPLQNQITNEIKKFEYNKEIGNILNIKNFDKINYDLQEIDASNNKEHFDKIFLFKIHQNNNVNNMNNNFINNQTQINNNRSNNLKDFNDINTRFIINGEINNIKNYNENNYSNPQNIINNGDNHNLNYNNNIMNNKINNANNFDNLIDNNYSNNNYNNINYSNKNNNQYGNINNNSYNNSNNFNNININDSYNKNNNQMSNNNNTNLQQNIINQFYYFPLKGLNNIGSTCYMNATLQCLLHISELISYFLKEYPNDSPSLKKKNKDIETKGNISEAFYQIVKGVQSDNNTSNELNINKLLNSNTSFVLKSKKFQPSYYLDNSKAYSPDLFKKVLGYYNPQFRRFEANDSKDLILYLLQTMHEELNYFGDNSQVYYGQPNQLDIVQTFCHFNQTYNIRNLSIISHLFYGTYINSTKCLECNKTIYSFQKFEFISFAMFDYNRKTFNIYNGFKDNEKPQLLKGNNQFYCSYCRKLCNALICSRIIQAPNKLIINIDYGKNKKFKPNNIEFDEIIDITQFINFNFGVIKYRIVGVCTHFGFSGSFGHYIAYCKHRNSGKWYKFNDSNFGECNNKEIYEGSPYLLLYELIN